MPTPLFVPLKDMQIVEPDALVRPAAHDWLSYWRALAAGSPDGVPRRADLDLIRDRPHLAPLAVWVEVLDDDYRYILAGEDVRWLFSRSIKDLRLSDLRVNGFAETARRQYDTAVATGRPCCSIGSYRFGAGSGDRVGGKVTEREMVIMPFANADGTIDRLLVGMAFETPGTRRSAL
jgi:hypothetical protein